MLTLLEKLGIYILNIDLFITLGVLKNCHFQLHLTM